MDHNVSRNWVVQLAYGFLQHSAKGVLLSQDTLRSRSDAERHPKALARFVGEHVYYYADDQSQVPDIELAFRHASALPFSIAILTTEQAEFPNSIRDCDCVDEARLAALCHFTRCILVNAYDDEGYLVWHR